MGVCLVVRSSSIEEGRGVYTCVFSTAKARKQDSSMNVFGRIRYILERLKIDRFGELMRGCRVLKCEW